MLFPIFQMMLDDVTTKPMDSARVDMWVRRDDARGPVVGKWSTEDDTIQQNSTGVDPLPVGGIRPLSRIIDYAPGRYVYDIQITEDEDVQTVVHGTWDILEDVTPS